jgi:hypothetical protein
MKSPSCFGVRPCFIVSTWSGTYAITSLDVSNGYYDNEAVANSLEANAVTGNVYTVLYDLILLV